MAGCWDEWKLNASVWGMWAYSILLARTCRLHTSGLESVEEIMRTRSGGVMIAWHGRMLLPILHFRHQGMYTIASLSRDGEYPTRILKRFGWHVIRGSTGRGGAKAAITAARKIKEGEMLAFTPDGPRGPAGKLQPGTLFFAQNSQRPIIPLGASAYPRRLLPTWDSYLVPLPFSRSAIVAGEPVFVPGSADEEELSGIASRIESALNSLQAQAEAIVHPSQRILGGSLK
ncbi:MAG: lysophospholipid acyltransferase family protein [Armatimonadetes bacterium]|nr:lysophospholipid acyltransferase family protein [Armatimonadota bacterium]